MSKSALPNEHKFREPWLHAALHELRPLFAKVGLEIPERVRCAFSITSAGTKGARKSECWPASASDDFHCEIFISPDIADPVEVLGQLCHAGVHACLPDDTGHGPAFKAAATRIGLEGKMRHAMPGPILPETLAQIAAGLGPLPHAKLDLSATILDRPPPADRPKKQGTRMLKAECAQCEASGLSYILRLSRMCCTEVGAPHCPKHGAMKVKGWSTPMLAGERLNAPDQGVGAAPPGDNPVSIGNAPVPPQPQNVPPSPPVHITAIPAPAAAV